MSSIDRPGTIIGYANLVDKPPSDPNERFKNIETREEYNFTQIMYLKERVRRLDRWFNVFIVVNLVIAALYLIT